MCLFFSFENFDFSAPLSIIMDRSANTKSPSIYSVQGEYKFVLQ